VGAVVTMLGIEASRGVTIAFAIFVLVVFLGGAAYLMLHRPRRKGTPDIPAAMRPGPADPQLEKPRLERMQYWGIITVVAMAVWIPAVWLNEPKQNETDQRNFNAASVAAGAASVQLNSQTNPTGIGCVRCHGPGLGGGYNVFNGTVVPVPNLQTVCGGPKYGHALIHSLTDVVNTIAEGRTGTDMPSWSVKFAGSLDDQQINDIVNYILSIQKVPFKDNVCINPQAAAG
jgi:mono/diheme cytochrome c family protein